MNSKLTLALLGAAIFLTAWGSLSYSPFKTFAPKEYSQPRGLHYLPFWTKPSDYDMQEMSKVLSEAVRKINELESEVSFLKNEVEALESRMNGPESKAKHSKAF